MSIGRAHVSFASMDAGPSMIPWILAECDGTKHGRYRKHASTRGRANGAITEVLVRMEDWVI